MVELTVKGQRVELGEKANDISYTAQIADVFDIGNVSVSHTNSFSFPKTPNNVQIMQQLGIVGDTSTIPYEKIPADLNHFGFPLVRNGWLLVKDTDDDYNGSLMNGMVDFFKAIENKTMGGDLDLSVFAHEKTLPTVISSWSNDYYKYIVADYNGKINIDDAINIDYLVPCFNVGKLFELMMATFATPYDPTNIIEINDLWVTYPKDPADNVVEEVSAQLSKEFFAGLPQEVSPGVYSLPNQFNWDNSVVNEGSLQNNWKYIIAEDGGYRIEAKTEMYAFYLRSFPADEKFEPMSISVLVNGVPVINYNSDPYQVIEQDVSMYLSTGDVVEYQFTRSPYQMGLYRMVQIRANSIELNIYKTSLGSVNLADPFKDFPIKDFFKEILWRTATTPVIDSFSNVMSFVTIDERLDFARAVDWSEKFVKRNKESYIYGSYAQRNVFAHKYNDEDDKSQNGYLNISNKNLLDEKTIVASKIYAPELVNTPITDGVSTKKFRIWNTETKENSDGEIEIQYKGLNGRFFFLKFQQSPTGSYTFKSEAVIDEEVVTQFPYATTEGTTFDQIVPAKYASYLGVLNNMRVHDIELALNMEDYLSLDLTRPVYIEAEGMYYMLNRVSFADSATVTGEFLRINKVLS